MGWLVVLAVVIAGAYWIEKASQGKRSAEDAALYANSADESWRWLKEYFDETIKETRMKLADKHGEFAEFRKQYGRPSYEERDLADKLARDEKAYKELSDLYAEVQRFEYRIRDRKDVKGEDIELLAKHLMVVFGRAANSYGARGFEGLWGADGEQYERFMMERQESEKIARQVMRKYA